MRSLSFAVSAVVCLAACVETPSTPTAPYRGASASALGSVTASAVTVVDLGTLGGSASRAFAINALGHVVGSAQRSDNVQLAAVWDGVWHALDLPQGASSAFARGVNGSDIVVGESSTSGAYQSVQWTPSGPGSWTMTLLPGLSGSPHTGTYAYAINTVGDVIGAEDAIGGGSYALVWRQEIPCKLSSPVAPDPAGMVPRGLNDNGWIAGNTSGGSAVVFVPSSYAATPCVGQLLVLPRDPTATGSHFATAVNVGGAITGWATAGQVSHALRWTLKPNVTAPTSTQDFTVTVLPGNDGAGWGITEDGTIAGENYPKAGLYTGGMWSPNNALTNLPPIAGYKTGEAAGIATVAGAHWAVGYSHTSQAQHATLWKAP